MVSGIAGAIAAESAVANEATVAALVKEALQKNPELKFYETELKAAKAGVRSAASWSNPELGGSIGAKRVASSEGTAWSVTVLQPFEWPGRIGLRKAIANRDVELAQLGFERFKTALASRVRALAYGVFAAQQKAAAAREVADRFQALREVLVQRDPAGITPLLETRVIEATELVIHRKASQAMVEMQAAALELNQLRGVEPTARVVVKEGQLKFRQPPELEVLFALAHTNNFELRTREVELAQQGLRVSLARNERYPAISIGPAYSEERAGERERILSVSVSAPLPLWNRNTANIDVAKTRQMQAETSLLVTQREVERRLTQAATAYQRGLIEMGKWRPDSAEHFRQAAELADRHYRLGAVPIATYIELQQNYLEAMEGLLDTKKEALEAAQELELLTGLELLCSLSTEEKP